MIKQLIEQLTAPAGVSGDEREAALAARELLSAYGKTGLDALGNVICTVQQPLNGQRHILLDAHIDQIGMIVQSVDDKGFVRVGACGGVDRRVLMASDVTVYGKEPLFGVVCSSPPHLAADGDEKKTPKLEDIAIDVGLDAEQARERIAPGDRVLWHGPVCEMNGGRLVSRALDDRASCAAILRTLELLKKQPLACGLTVLFSTREEVGGQGASTGAYAVRPTEALIVDVSFAHTPDAPRHKCGEMGKGPMIGIAPTLSRAIFERLCKLAKQEQIPCQIEVMDGTTGTNADQIIVSRQGVPGGMVSIPIKYMHTPAETVDPNDIEHSARLLAAYIQDKGGER